MARVREAMAAAPESPKVLLQRAKALISADKDAEALPLLEKYVECQGAPGRGASRLRRGAQTLGKVLKDLQRFAEAEAALRQALAIDEKALALNIPTSPSTSTIWPSAASGDEPLGRGRAADAPRTGHR